MKQSGIYMITCSANNKIYIGSAVNLKIRWKRHRNELINNKHVNVILQNAFNKYGLESFSFEIIEIVDDGTNLFEREQHYLDTLKPFGKYGFNIKIIASGGGNFEHHPNKKEIYRKISETKRKQKLIVSDEHKAYLSEKLSEYYLTHPHSSKNKTYEEIYGVEKAKELKEKIRENNKTKFGEANPFYNKKHTQEAKDKMSKFHKGKYLGTQNVKVIIDGKIYLSYGAAGKKIGISAAGVKYRCISNNFPNYKLYDK